jgi:clan AA aspartic protease (TIGR02281 family)
LTKTNAILISLVTFCLGYFMNDYLSNRGVNQGQWVERGGQRAFKEFTLRNPDDVSIDAIEGSINGSINASGNQGAVTEAASNAEEFSWDLVNQLIAKQNYDKAISLLEKYLTNHGSSAEAWRLLAYVYQKQNKPVPAFNAWIQYFKCETDSSKIYENFLLAKQYLLQLHTKPEAYGADTAWLMSQLNALTEVNSSDGELHLILASLYLSQGDSYQAQYHALMAVNDPVTKKSAEDILEKLNGKETTGEMVVPLIRYGHQFLVDVVVDGNSARLLLDTGASISGVSNTFVTRFPSMIRDRKPIRLNTANGSVDSFLFTVNRVTIGNLIFNQHILAVLPMDDGADMDGLLGVDIIGRFDFVIDQDALLLKLRSRRKN